MKQGEIWLVNLDPAIDNEIKKTVTTHPTLPQKP